MQDLVCLPLGKRFSIVGVSVKFGIYGQFECLKARLVIKGYTQIYGLDYVDTFSPASKIPSARLLVACASIKQCLLYQ